MFKILHESNRFAFRFRRKLQNNDIAFHVHHLMESIPQEAFERFLRNGAVLLRQNRER